MGKEGKLTDVDVLDHHATEPVRSWVISEVTSCNTMEGRMVVMTAPWEWKLRNCKALSRMLKILFSSPSLLFRPMMTLTTKKLK